ncbi:MAG: DMT family transporter [Betaproteobacteria bacterium]
MTLTHRRAVCLMVLVTLLWSTAGVVTRQLEQARSFEVTFWRSFFTALSLLVMLPLMRGRTVFSQLAAGGWSLWLSGLCWSVMFTAFMLAMTLTSVANVLVTLAIGPFLTAVVARLLIGHRIAGHTWLAIAVAGIGIAWMHSQQFAIGPAGHWAGTLVALLVPIAGAINWTLVQRTQGQKVDLVPAVLVGAFLSSLATLPLALPWSASSHDLAWLAFLGLIQLAIPCVLSVLCASALKAPEISLLALLEVIFGILLAWVGAGEVPAASVLTGGALVIGALVANEWVTLQQRTL